MPKTKYIGADLSKLEVVVDLAAPASPRAFANDPKGRAARRSARHLRIDRRLSAQLGALLATGRRARERCHAPAGTRVRPRTGPAAKTDKLDAQLLDAFEAAMQSAPARTLEARAVKRPPAHPYRTVLLEQLNDEPAKPATAPCRCWPPWPANALPCSKPNAARSSGASRRSSPRRPAGRPAANACNKSRASARSARRPCSPSFPSWALLSADNLTRKSAPRPILTAPAPATANATSAAATARSAKSSTWPALTASRKTLSFFNQRRVQHGKHARLALMRKLAELLNTLIKNPAFILAP